MSSISSGTTHAGPDIGVIALVPERWESISRTTRHNVLQRLARHFRVVWVEPPVYWREYRAGAALQAHSRRPFDPAPGLHVLPTDLMSARIFRPAALARALERRRLRRAAALLREHGCRRIVLYIWRPEFASAVDLIPADAVLYHIDDEYTFSKVDRPVPPAEAALIRRADRVIVHSQTLLEKKGGINPNTHLIPNGVDFHAFSTPAPEPAALRDVPRPRIGYVGVIKQQLNLTLLLDLARRQPEWSFVFVGPVGAIGDQAVALSALQKLPNCHFIDRQPPEALPGFVQHMDVCTLPYVVDGYTRYIYPLKLHEYLAAGRPVVAAPIPALEQFRDVVTTAETAEQWISGIERALAADACSPDAARARRSIAENHDWDALVRQIAAVVSSALSRSEPRS
mgnify:CR=1 FL=1